MAKEIYGIDLGTTYSCIAEMDMQARLPIVVKNDEGLQTTPSVVYYDEYGSPIVGGEAKRNMKADASRAVAFIKREMANPNYKRRIDSEDINPVKISAMILKKLVDDANRSREYQGKSSIKDVVITVPAYFGNNERALTKQAGEVAGLNVLGLLNEPTAAALSYGSSSFNGKTFMVYDLGGGTFDVSIMRMQNNKLETLSTDGDHHLGGIDWDSKIVEYALKTCCNSTDDFETIKDSREGGALLEAAELCKKALSTQEEAPLRFRYKGRMYSKDIRRSWFEEVTYDLIERTLDVIDHAFEICTESNVHLDEIILVGGSSYMPMVRKSLTRKFPNVSIRLDQFEPDLAVAKGAAIHAYNLANPYESNFGRTAKIDKDLSSRSYGVECMDSETDEEIIQNLITRSEPMIYSGTATTVTREEGQVDVFIAISENLSTERFLPREEGKRIAYQTIDWGYAVPKGTVINYTINRGSDGIIHIEVECQGKKVYFEIKPDMMLKDYEKDQMTRDLGRMQL